MRSKPGIHLAFIGVLTRTFDALTAVAVATRGVRCGARWHWRRNTTCRWSARHRSRPKRPHNQRALFSVRSAMGHKRTLSQITAAPIVARSAASKLLPMRAASISSGQPIAEAHRYAHPVRELRGGPESLASLSMLFRSGGLRIPATVACRVTRYQLLHIGTGLGVAAALRRAR
jgi:hypothetical protein